jgi:thiamine-monophosphate kinase
MESEFVAWLRERLPPHPLLRLGPGDDAAVLRLGDRAECVVTVDLLTDGVDFQVGQVDPRRIGRKALAVNLSDLAAMAARPVAAVIALALPRQGGLALARQLYEGLLPLAAEHHVAIAGGDTNAWDGPLAISITALGETTVRGPLQRKGARPGDVLMVTGELGGSILGKHFDFEPRVREALALHARYDVRAGIDISDGLALDLGRLADESSVGAEVRTDLVPVSAAAHRLAAERGDGTTALDHALGDGEDFELLLAVAPEDASRMAADSLGVRLTAIGRFVAEPGLWRIDAGQVRRPLARTGFEHSMTP